VPVPIVTIQMSRMLRIRARPLANVRARSPNVDVRQETVHAAPAPRHIPKSFLTRTRSLVSVVEMIRIAPARRESVVAAAAPNKFLPWVSERGMHHY
jgi:hypothetical protein